MTSHDTSASGPKALKASIRDVELSIRRHRSRIAIALDGVSQDVGKKVISPGTVIAAALLGAALQQNLRLRGMHMLALMHRQIGKTKCLFPSKRRFLLCAVPNRLPERISGTMILAARKSNQNHGQFGRTVG